MYTIISDVRIMCQYKSVPVCKLYAILLMINVIFKNTLSKVYSFHIFTYIQLLVIYVKCLNMKAFPCASPTPFC